MRRDWSRSGRGAWVPSLLWRARRCQPCPLPSRSDAETWSEPASSAGQMAHLAVARMARRRGRSRSPRAWWAGRSPWRVRRRQLDRGRSRPAVLWRGRRSSELAPRRRRAEQLIGVSSSWRRVRHCRVGARPDRRGPCSASWGGIGLAPVTLVAMSPLAAAKRRVGRALGSSPTVSESRQTMPARICRPPRRSGNPTRSGVVVG